MRIVAGLGNPGEEYTGTRHNVGFEVIDRLASRHRLTARPRGGVATVAECKDGKAGPFLLVKPLTYMNRSGGPLRMVMKDFMVEPSDVLVVVDDIHLELGRLRLRATGSEGGHNGLRSITDALGTRDYGRLRVGVGPAPDRMPWETFVLQRFKPADRQAAAEAFDRAADAAEDWLDGTPVESLMSRYNGV